MNKQIRSLLISLFCALLFTAPASAQTCGKEDYKCQIADYTKMIAADAGNAENYYNRAGAFRNDGKYDQAITDYTRYISTNPANKSYLADGYHYRGLAYKLKGDMPRAIADYDRAIQLLPGNATFHYNRGRAYASQKSYDLALADFNTAISLSPDDSVYLVDRGHAYMGKKDYASAYADFTLAIKLNKNDAEAYYNRAIISQDRKEHQKAIDDLNIYITMNTGNIPYLSDGYQNRAISYSALGNYAQAVKDLTAAIDLDPKDPSPLKTRASIYRKQGKIALAEADERKAASLPK